MSKNVKQYSAALTNKRKKVTASPLLVAAGACALRPVEDATFPAQPPDRGEYSFVRGRVMP